MALKSRVTNPKNFSSIVDHIYKLVDVDRQLNRSLYYQRLAAIVEQFPQFNYRDVILTYLHNYVKSLYPESETTDNLIKNQKLIASRKETERQLQNLGVFYPKQLLSQFIRSAPQCF